MQIATGSVQKENNRNIMILIGKISIYHRNQLLSLRVGELDLYINHNYIAFKGKKGEKMRVVKSHIGIKILTSIVQDSENNIQPASDSNSESNIDSDRVKKSALLDLVLVVLQNYVTQEIRQQIVNLSNKLSLVRLDTDTGRKRTRVLCENYKLWHNIHVEMYPRNYNKTPN